MTFNEECAAYDRARAVEKWDRRFLELARHVAQWSKDPSTKVGAVIVEPNRRAVVAMGYNGFPRGVEDTVERLNDRALKYQMVAHAELNAILNAILNAVASVEGCTLYVWPTFLTGHAPTCNERAKAVIQAGIAEVVAYRQGITDDVASASWKEELRVAGEMYQETNVQWRFIDGQ